MINPQIFTYIVSDIPKSVILSRVRISFFIFSLLCSALLCSALCPALPFLFFFFFLLASHKYRVQYTFFFLPFYLLSLDFIKFICQYWHLMILVSHCKQILFQLLSGCAHLGSEDDSCVAGCPVEKGISWCRKVYGRAVLNFCPCLAGCGCLLYNIVCQFLCLWCWKLGWSWEVWWTSVVPLWSEDPGYSRESVSASLQVSGSPSVYLFSSSWLGSGMV